MCRCTDASRSLERSLDRYYFLTQTIWDTIEVQDFEWQYHELSSSSLDALSHAFDIVEGHLRLTSAKQVCLSCILIIQQTSLTLGLASKACNGACNEDTSSNL